MLLQYQSRKAVANIKHGLQNPIKISIKELRIDYLQI